MGYGRRRNEASAQNRIETDECCICYSNIEFEVGATCGHIFCGKRCEMKGVFRIWNSGVVQ